MWSNRLVPWLSSLGRKTRRISSHRKNDINVDIWWSDVLAAGSQKWDQSNQQKYVNISTFQRSKGSLTFQRVSWQLNGKPIQHRWSLGWRSIYFSIFISIFKRKILGTFEDCRKHPLRMLSFSSWWFRENAIVGFIAWHHFIWSHNIIICSYQIAF